MELYNKLHDKRQSNVGWNMLSAMTCMHCLFAMQWCLIHDGIGPEMVEHITWCRQSYFPNSSKYWIALETKGLKALHIYIHLINTCIYIYKRKKNINLLSHEWQSRMAPHFQLHLKHIRNIYPMLLMEEIRLTSWGWWFILFTGFYISQVVQDFFHQQYRL